MNRYARVLVAALLGISACKDDDPVSSPPPDAQVSSDQWQHEALGLSLSLSSVWSVGSSSFDRSDRVEIIGRILRRRVHASVVPRIIITREQLTPEMEKLTDGSLFSRILGDLRKIADNPKTRIVRTAWSTRFIESHAIGDLELAYATTNADDKLLQIIQRSWVLRRPQATPPALVILNATYLKKDEDPVANEVESILSTLRIKETAAPPPKGPPTEVKPG